MNSAIFKVSNSNDINSSFRAALFHSTPPLQRKRRNHWDSDILWANSLTLTIWLHKFHKVRNSGYVERLLAVMTRDILFGFQKFPSMSYFRTCFTHLLKVEWLATVWRRLSSNKFGPCSSLPLEEYVMGFRIDPSQGTSWFKKQYSDGGTGRYRNANKGSSHQYRNDFDVETSFRSAFGGNRFFYWSFINEENPQWRRSERSDSHLVSDRLALGLSVSGPLKLEDVKNAYRPCALKWHPDRHQGSSKAVAEEKFELCSAAYQSLCDSLALD
ncbi:hypothetical protein AAZX31_03G127000 [Glycine max]